MIGVAMKMFLRGIIVNANIEGFIAILSVDNCG